MRVVGLWVVALIAVSCGSSAPLPWCERFIDTLTVRTVDGAATIARLDMSCGPAEINSGCRPASGTRAASSDAPCAEVRITLRFVSSCDLTFTSVDGRTVTETVRVTTVPGSEYQCRDNDHTTTATRASLKPRMITVDFAQADGGLASGG